MQAYCVKCRTKKGDEGSEVSNDEEWKTGNSGHMPHMWHKDV